MRLTPPAAAAALSALADAQAAPPVGLALGRWLAGLDPDRATPLALTGALLARVEADGQAGLALDAWAGHPFPPPNIESRSMAALPSLPAAADWADLLAASALVGGPDDEPAPLVLDGGRVYLRRLWTAERRVAERLLERLDPPDPLAPPDTLREAFGRLFPDADGDAPDLQAVACASALRHRLAVVSGGPGTGKTTTAARLLALACAARPGLRVALAAPTGKAAQRLHESMQGQLDRLGPDGIALSELPEPQTVHRLLGADVRGRFRRHAEAPLAADLVLVDEASMLDLPLLDALLDALPPTARLILLGDADQLAAVGVGSAFGDLCRLGAGGSSPDFAAFCCELGLDGVSGDPAALPVSDSVVTLWKSHRFEPEAGIGALAAALRTGDAERSLEVLSEAPEAILLGGGLSGALGRVLDHAHAVLRTDTPEAALEALGRFQLLAVTRRGPQGVERANATVEATLREQGRISPDAYYRGRPVLITSNDYSAGLFNGDLGVAWPTGGVPTVVFSDGHGGSRSVPVSRLPLHESAWAMTVHKSQGSEFDAVTVLLPPEPTPLLTRELLYTAVTRARTTVAIAGAPALVRYAATHTSRSASGLALRLASKRRNSI